MAISFILWVKIYYFVYLWLSLLLKSFKCWPLGVSLSWLLFLFDKVLKLAQMLTLRETE